MIWPGILSRKAIRTGLSRTHMVENPQTIDFIAHDPKTDRVVLAMVEHRPWGDRGALLPDLQKKLNTYLGFVLGGQLVHHHPQFKDKKVSFVLQTQHPLGAREQQFVGIVERQHLTPRDIAWSVRHLGTEKQDEHIQASVPPASSDRGAP
jgi:hypothetical protein